MGIALYTEKKQDNLTIAREIFGVTYAIGRSAALVLHVDVALILFRKIPGLQWARALLTYMAAVCRTLISLARQTPLNGIIQFGTSLQDLFWLL